MALFSLLSFKAALVVAKAAMPAVMLQLVGKAQRAPRFGRLRRLEPISRCFGLDRGQPIDRHYIERFLAGCSGDIRGRVLEIGDDTYTRKFGGRKVTRREVLHVFEGNPRATIVADLAAADHVPSSSFDCIICTQTLMFIYDVRAAVRTLHRLLKPGGVALVTVAGISQACRWDMDQWGDYWRFTTMAAQRLFAETFDEESVGVESHGNVLAAISFLHGLCAEDLEPGELDHQDRDYPMLITIRAVKQATEGA